MSWTCKQSVRRAGTPPPKYRYVPTLPRSNGWRFGSILKKSIYIYIKKTVHTRKRVYYRGGGDEEEVELYLRLETREKCAN